MRHIGEVFPPHLSDLLLPWLDLPTAPQRHLVNLFRATRATQHMCQCAVVHLFIHCDSRQQHNRTSLAGVRAARLTSTPQARRVACTQQRVRHRGLATRGGRVTAERGRVRVGDAECESGVREPMTLYENRDTLWGTQGNRALQGHCPRTQGAGPARIDPGSIKSPHARALEALSPFPFPTAPRLCTGNPVTCNEGGGWRGDFLRSHIAVRKASVCASEQSSVRANKALT